MSDPAQGEETIFNAALKLPAGERAAYLQSVCGGDAQLLARILALLEAIGHPIALDKTLVVSFPLTEQSGDKIGHYKLLEQIGEGGFGVVYVAEQEEPVRRRVAVKVIKMGMDTKEVIARFEAERQALALMDHPNIAKVLDAGATASGRPYFVMELVKGDRITDYCDKNNLPMRARIELFVQACQAIQHAHQKGIIHRDIKPSNVLVTVHGETPVPKVIDFGIAKATGQRLTDKTIYTALEQMIGTPAYMSPEQAEMSGVDIDTRSDIYSLGVLLYELLTGKTPFDPDELAEAGLEAMRRTIREKEPQRPSTRLTAMVEGELTATAKRRQTDSPKLVHLVRGDLDWIVMKCLEKDRTRRYETTNGLASDLLRHFNNEPVLARPPSNAYRFQKMVRRNKLAFAAGAAVGAAVLAGLAVSTFLFLREREAHDRALAAEQKQSQLRIEAETESKKAKSEAARATRSETLAEQRLKDSEAVTKFLAEMFQSPTPGREGQTTNIAEILGFAARKLETDLPSQPARRIYLQEALAATYHALGLYSEAISLKEKVRDYHLATLGPEHATTLWAMLALAQSYDRANRQAEALKLREKVLALRRKLLGPEHRDTIAAMGDLANSLDEAGRFDESVKLRQEQIALRRKVFGPEHTETIWAILGLAESYDRANRLEEALKMRVEVLTLRRKVLGPEHRDTIDAMAGLASSYDKTGRFDESIKLRQEQIALCRKVFGPEHSKTLWAINGLAESFALAGRRDEALKLQEQVLTIRRKVLGPEHRDTIDAMANVAYSYQVAGRRDEALKLGEQVLALNRQVLGPEHPSTLWAMQHLADFSDDVGRRDDAIKLREETLALRREALGLEHPDTIWIMRDLASSYDLAGRLDEALKLREEALSLSRKTFGPKQRQTLFVMEGLAELYCAVGRSKEGTDLLAQVCQLDPQNPFAALKLATWQTWFGQESDYEATRRRVVQQAEGTQTASMAEQAAKAYCLRPSTDPAMLAKALALAQRGLELEPTNTSYRPWYYLTVGVAQYRNGQYAAAEHTLTVAEQTGGMLPYYHVAAPARFFRALSLLRQDRLDDARKVFHQAEAQMPPLPDDERAPLVHGRLADHVMLICWLGYKQAKSSLNPPAATGGAQTSNQEDSLPPLIHAHAHNDYEHTHPLFDALSHGFASVEADIHLTNGQLLVAHDIKHLRPERTLQSLYLDPLRARAAKYGGRIYTNGESTFYLLIDTKTETNATYAALRRVLENYSDMLTGFSSNGVTPRAVTVVLTGNRPREMLPLEPARLAGLDGQWSDLGKPDPQGLFLWISDNWGPAFTWRGNGPIPPEERARVLQIVAQAHQLHAKARFWGAPDTPAFWQEMRQDGVDLLNVDDLAGVEKFLRGQPPYD